MPKRLFLAASAVIVILCLLGFTVWTAAAPARNVVRADIDAMGAALPAATETIATIAPHDKRSTSTTVAGPLMATEVALRTPLVMPVSGITRGQLRDNYGEARGVRSHGAIDIMAARGTPVVAVADGKVLKLFTSVRGGLTIYLGLPSSRLMYYYAHLDRYADGVHAGSLVRQGELIGYVGSTGDASPDAPHLHFAIEELPLSGEWWKGQPMNPYPILMAHVAHD
jgi:murein DD-endopeptidase MepM/ murein hydrolase activator NlpD